jgi:signal transduction histidine kinase
VGAILYSILLYVILKKKCAEIQECYRKLLEVTSAIAEGDLNVSVEEDMGLLNPVRDELAAIQNGFKKAVEEEVRSRNMKTELITNVSHDLKTPLTAIITYVDLLKKEDLTDEERRSYVETLDKKSQRLKVLIEDLFEVSKATTDNITMNFEDVDLVSLIKQVRLESEEKIEESTLDFRWNLPDEKCILSLDPQRTFRVVDNLIQNILKYAMPHSRVYIDLKDESGEVTVSFKNISATEMNFSAEEITERFVRGDLSRNTEGSGLGLAIAQSFTELQNGTLQVETDGDLFKVTIRFVR